MFDYDSLNIALYRILAEEIPEAKNSELLRLANRLGEAAVEKMPKHGDFWLNEDDGVLYVNKGWEVVCAEALEVTPEENERRFKEALKLIQGVTHEQLVDLMGEEWLEEFRKVAQ